MIKTNKNSLPEVITDFGVTESGVSTGGNDAFRKSFNAMSEKSGIALCLYPADRCWLPVKPSG
jgi:hypothetical protein